MEFLGRMVWGNGAIVELKGNNLAVEKNHQPSLMEDFTLRSKNTEVGVQSFL